MALFNWFGVKPNGKTEVTPKEDVSSEEISTPGEVSTGNGNDTLENHLITITWGTGMPIDIIFNFIHKNFEEEGFQDALVNCDITYRDAKERIIRNDLEMLFKRIILRYKNDIREIEVNIKNAKQAYALAASGRLQARKETFEEHLLEIDEMLSLLEKNDPKMLTMIESYRRGFQNGMAAVAINFIDNK